MGVNVGPTANLPGYARRSGRSGKVFRDGRMLGEVVSVEWGMEVEQIAITIPGSWRTENKPGGETRTVTFRVQDVHDAWALELWQFIDARRRGDRSSAFFPEFSIVTVLDDIGAPRASRWQLDGCQLFRLDGGHNQDDDQIIRDIPATYRAERPLDTYSYTDAGIQVFQG